MTYEEVHSLFVYEPETGQLRRIGGRVDYPWRGIGTGRRYLATTVAGKTYYAHRLVWLYHHGETPAMIDHINGDFRDNRIENLRACTNAQNQYNGPRKSHNRSGYKGVAFCKGYRKPWRARIIVDKQPVELGYYDTPEAAASAYAEGAKRYAREFARVD
jgi:hypothetical protein